MNVWDRQPLSWDSRQALTPFVRGFLIVCALGLVALVLLYLGGVL